MIFVIVPLLVITFDSNKFDTNKQHGSLLILIHLDLLIRTVCIHGSLYGYGFMLLFPFIDSCDPLVISLFGCSGRTQESIAASMFSSPEPKKLFGTESKLSRPQGG